MATIASEVPGLEKQSFKPLAPADTGADAWEPPPAPAQAHGDATPIAEPATALGDFATKDVDPKDVAASFEPLLTVARQMDAFGDDAAYLPLRELAQENPQALLYMPLTSEDIHNLLETGIDDSGHVTRYNESVDLLEAARASGDPFVQARFFREATTFLGEDGRDDAMHALPGFGTGPGALQSWWPHGSWKMGQNQPEEELREVYADVAADYAAFEDYSNFRNATGELLLDDPRAVTEQLRANNTRVSSLIARDTTGDLPAGDLNGAALGAYFSDAVQEVPRDPSAAHSTALVTQYLGGLLDPSGVGDGGLSAFAGDDGFTTAGNLGYAAGALDNTVATSEASTRQTWQTILDLVQEGLVAPVGGALRDKIPVAGGLLNRGLNQLWDAGERHDLPRLVDRWDDTRESLQPFRDLTLPDAPDSEVRDLADSGDPYAVYNAFYDQVYDGKPPAAAE